MAKNHTFKDVRVQTKRDTAKNWATNDPVLLYGEEILVDTDAGEVRKKVGDGTKKYSELPFTDEVIRNSIANKVDKVTGKDLSTNDYTTTEKEKLEGIEDGANKYTHPTHTAYNSGMYKVTVDKEGHITGASAITKADIVGLGIPAEDTNTTYSEATATESGLLSGTDKTKLDGIEAGAQVNQNAFANVKVGTNIVVADAKSDTFELVGGTNVNITATDDKITISATNTTYSEATTSSDGLMSSEDKTKLDGIEEGANKYTHPSTHAATMITEDSTHRFVTDAEKTAWNSKASTDVVTSSANGLMASDDKIKLDGIEAGANNYSHPATHAATMITEDSTHRFVTDTEKSTWNAKASTDVATTAKNGLMSSDDKSKLDGIEEGANKYTHPTYNAYESGLYKVTVNDGGHISSATKVTKADITGLGVPAQDTTYTAGTGIEIDGTTINHSNSVAAGTAKGDDSKTLAYGGTFTIPTVKYDEQGHITAAGTTTMTMPAKPADYVHPSTHAATMIVEDSTHRFVTDDQIAEWDGKADETDLTSHTGNTSNPHNVTKAQVGLGNVTNDAQVKRSEMGVAGGVATLDSNGMVPSSQLPSYVDDVVEGYYSNSKFHSDSGLTNVITAESGKIYIDLTSGKTYRWSGTAYAVISETLALGETASTAYAGDKGKANADAIELINEKLDTVDDNANYYVHPTYSDKASGLYKITVTGGHVSAATAVVKSDITGLGIPAQDTTYTVATTSANGLMSKDDKVKLDGVEEKANYYVHPTTHAPSIIAQDANNRFVTDAEKTAWNAKASTAVATTSANGLMSAADKTKLEGIESGAQVNQNAFANVKVGSTTVAADSASGSFTLVAGTNVSITANATNDTITISATNTTYSVATTSANGLMSSTDKTNLEDLINRVAAIEAKLQTAVFFGE